MFSKEWLLSEDTGKLKKYLKEYIEEVKDMWASGQFTGESSDSTVQLNAKAIGTVHFAETLLEELVEKTHDD